MPAPALRPYQTAGIDWLASRLAAILGDAMGLGKTAQYLRASAMAAPGGLVLILAPEATLPGLRAQIALWTPGAAVRTLARSAKGDRATAATAAGLPAYVLLGWTSAAARAAELLAGPRFAIVVLDEAHRVKDQKARVTKAVLGRWAKTGREWARTPCLVAHADRVWASTGTPIPNRPIELQPLLHLGLGQRWASRSIYGEAYCQRPNRWSPSGYDLLGAHHLDDLNSRLRAAGVLLRRTAEDVPGELPTLSVELVPLAGIGRDPIPDGLDAEKIRAAIGERDTVGFEEIAKYRAALGERKAAPVAEWACEWLEENEGEALVLYFWHKKALADCAALLREAGHEVLAVDGDLDPVTRQDAVDQFAGGHGRVFLGTIAVCGTGLNGLHLRTTVCALAECPWTPGEVSQAIGRVRRLGSVGARTTAYLLAGEDSLESHILQTVAEKLTVSETILADTAAPAAAPDPVALPALPEVPEPLPCPATGWTWARLRDGGWGLRIGSSGCPAWAGERVRVKSRAGEEKRVALGARVACGVDWSLWSIEAQAPADRARDYRAWRLARLGYSSEPLRPEDAPAVAAAVEACARLEAADGDRGAERNEIGWSGSTRAWGAFLAGCPAAEWTTAHLQLARRVLAPHKKNQIPATLAAAIF